MAAGDQHQYGSCDNDPVVTVTVAAGTGTVRVVNMTGTAQLAFTTNGDTPSLTGDNKVLPASIGASVLADMEGGGTAVKLLSDATGTTYGVWVVG